ncbi:TRM11 family SAM-dependent methyltransferase [Solibacillus daqui]|uniref:TRM11 family SAM-dependent methyltransferase n=1 Tax=Solibacillus daqui TaxID=2912187 RepID=UPI0023665B07|nr:RNA methyltransferase [Solibacillus daqui]
MQYLYSFAWQKDEFEISRLEMRTFFNFDVEDNVLISEQKIEPSRSPFVRERLDIWAQGTTIEQLVGFAKQIQLGDKSFKIHALNNSEDAILPKLTRTVRNDMMRKIGFAIDAEPDLDNPDLLIGLVLYKDVYYLGELVHGEAVWLHHMQKPEMYSTALSTRDARAIVNIAAPFPQGLKVIDPCCGIGTVLVEAMSMGIPIEGRDINKRVVWGSRINLRHFGYEPRVEVGPIEEASEGYDVAIIDMPYNLFTHISEDLQQSIITNARRIAKRVIIVTIEAMDDKITRANLTITDQAILKKGTFERQVLICE